MGKADARFVTVGLLKAEPPPGEPQAVQDDISSASPIRSRRPDLYGPMTDTQRIV